MTRTFVLEQAQQLTWSLLAASYALLMRPGITWPFCTLKLSCGPNTLQGTTVGQARDSGERIARNPGKTLQFFAHKYEMYDGHGHGLRHGQWQGHGHGQDTDKDLNVECRILVKSFKVSSDKTSDTALFSPISDVPISGSVDIAHHGYRTEYLST
jgi:hypothetical protein